MTDSIRIRVARELGIEPDRRWRVFYDAERQHGSLSMRTQAEALDNIQKEKDFRARIGEEYVGDISEPEEYYEWGGAPPYDTDETTAIRELCGQLKSEGWSVEASNWTGENMSNNWDVQFWIRGTRESHEATADSLALAICLAFLKVKASLKEE